MTGKEMVKAYIEAGWEIDRIKGSHHVMKKGQDIEVIPVHANKELPSGLQSKLKKLIGLN